MKMFTIISILLLSFAQLTAEPITNYESMEQIVELASEKPTVLFFKANWCPACRNAHNEFNKDVEQLSDINLVVVNYDRASDLKTKYGVTYQHTFVQIDSNGDAVTKWSGGATDTLLNKVIK